MEKYKMHWCIDETLALLSIIPFMGYFFGKLHAWWHVRFSHKCHEKNCNQVHNIHCKMPANIPHGLYNQEQCEQHPQEDTTKLRLVVPEGFDAICVEDAEEKFGVDIIDHLLDDKQLLKYDGFVSDTYFGWWVSDDGCSLIATFQYRKFIHHKHNSYVWLELL